jgi:hypothetical protein
MSGRYIVLIVPIFLAREGPLVALLGQFGNTRLDLAIGFQAN